MVAVLVDFLTLQQDQHLMAVQAAVVQDATLLKQTQVAQPHPDKGPTAVQVFLVLVMLSQALAAAEKMP
jgi:hypothetical protein